MSPFNVTKQVELIACLFTSPGVGLAGWMGGRQEETKLRLTQSSLAGTGTGAELAKTCYISLYDTVPLKGGPLVDLRFHFL